MAFRIKPKDEKFFQYLMDHAELIKQSANVLHQAIHDQSQLDELLNEIDDIEKQADRIVSKVMQKLHKTFITPFDREDIFTLAQRLDDVLDCIKGLIERIDIYDIGTPSEGIQELAKVVEKCVKQLVKAIACLEDIKKHRLKIEARCNRIVDLEAEGDTLYRREMGTLFRECNDPIKIIKTKEILTNLEEVLDFCEDVADSLKRVVLKYA